MAAFAVASLFCCRRGLFCIFYALSLSIVRVRNLGLPEDLVLNVAHWDSDYLLTYVFDLIIPEYYLSQFLLTTTVSRVINIDGV